MNINLSPEKVELLKELLTNPKYPTDTLALARATMEKLGGDPRVIREVTEPLREKLTS